MYNHVINDFIDRDVFIDLFQDHSGVVRLFLLVDDVFSFINCESDLSVVDSISLVSRKLFCFDIRRFYALDLKLPGNIFDVRLVGESSKDLIFAARNNLNDVSSLVSAKKDFDIHLRVCKTAKVDLSRHSLFNIIPESTILKLALERLKAIKSLALYYSKNDLEWYSSYLLPFSRTLCEIEQNGIYVDVDRASFELKNSDIEVVKSLSANIVQTNINGYVYSKFDPCGGKTGRIRVTGGFNCHSIPHGISREMLISRYEAGKIAVFDYNAIDYRSIISSIGGEIAKEYEGCNDFHTKTAEIFLNKLPIDSVEKRDLVKKLAYICMYGGSEDTAAQRSGLSVFNVRKFMIAFDNRFPQITKFRSDLYSSAMKSGYVITPFGKKINVSKDDHSGKVLGLYAQTFSSYVFAKALIKVNEALKECKTKIIFTVHDELVLDVHENEIEILPRIKSLMENVDSFKFHVNVKIGDNYGIASN